MAMRRVRRRQGLFAIEQAALIAIVVMAGVGMTVYVQRGLGGRWRSVADIFGHGRQYEHRQRPVERCTPQCNTACSGLGDGWIVRGIGDASVEAHLAKPPRLPLTNPASQGADIVIGICIPKGFAGGVEKILAVNERYGFLGRWLGRHYSPLK